MHDRLVSRRIDASHQCFLVLVLDTVYFFMRITHVDFESSLGHMSDGTFSTETAHIVFM